MINMKVLSYLGLGKDLKYLTNEYKVANDNGMCLYDFYSQPFKPELITELFEGFIYLTNKLNKEHIIIEGRGADDDTVQFYPESDSYTIGEIQFQVLPRTLDDFINDCQRAGIELTWRIK
jgi:hypothetical protein